MKLYNSYIKKTQDGDIQDLLFVQNGFSIFALLFNFIWFCFHKMFRASLFALICIWAVAQIFNLIGINGFLAFLLSFLSTSLIIAVNGNFWYSKYLRAKKYEFVGCFFGKNKEAAKLRFVEQYIGEVGEDVISKYKFLDKQDRKLLKARWKKEADEPKKTSKTEESKAKTAKSKTSKPKTSKKADKK